MRINGLPEVVRLYARQLFVDNEASTDEYRETQPEKGLGHVLLAAHTIEAEHKAREPGPDSLLQSVGDNVRLMELLVTWVKTGPNSSPYVGCDEFTPLIGFVFDVCWKAGFHPYYDDNVREVAGYLREMAEGSENEAEIVAALADIPPPDVA